MTNTPPLTDERLAEMHKRWKDALAIPTAYRADKEYQRENFALVDELIELRRRLGEAGEALDYLIKDNDGWIKCGIDSLSDPKWASACANPEQVRSEERDEIALRQKHAATLRALRGLVRTTDKKESVK